MSNPFVRVNITDDDVPVRQPLTSSDVLVNSGSVLTSISSIGVTPSDVTSSTNLISSDLYVSPGVPLSCINPVNLNVSSITNSPLVTGGAYVNNGLLTLISSISTAGVYYSTTATLYSVVTSA